MSPPRKPFGTDVPGRLPATRIKVLAAELSDPARLSRGKRYWTDDAVVDITVGHGVVTAEVQGSRAECYVVTVEADPGHGVPASHEVTTWCTCPDLDPSGRCKHVVAVLFALSDEVAVEPGLVSRWRRSDQVPAPRAAAVPAPAGRANASVRAGADRSPAHALDGSRSRPPVGAAADPPAVSPVDPLEDLLRGAPLPPLPVLSDLVHPRPPARPLDQLVAPVLDDALDHLRIRWD